MVQYSKPLFPRKWQADRPRRRCVCPFGDPDDGTEDPCLAHRKRQKGTAASKMRMWQRPWLTRSSKGTVNQGLDMVVDESSIDADGPASTEIAGLDFLLRASVLFRMRNKNTTVGTNGRLAAAASAGGSQVDVRGAPNSKSRGCSGVQDGPFSTQAWAMRGQMREQRATTYSTMDKASVCVDGHSLSSRSQGQLWHLSVTRGALIGINLQRTT